MSVELRRAGGEGKRQKTRETLSTREAVLLRSFGYHTRLDAHLWKWEFLKANRNLKAEVRP